MDGLYVETAALELGLPRADFSQLPYNVSNGTVNREFPNLAEVAFHNALGRPDKVSGDALSFPKGLHLHWALPDALTTGHHRDNRTIFPAVPNRWLVRRLDHTGKLEKSWIVESDFLHPLNNNGQPIVEPPGPITAWPNNQPITFPTERHQLPDNIAGAAFRYMGRSMSLSDWLNRNEATGEYLNQDANSRYKLTALGYGEPAFAAYYPNCYSVFGFCDIDPDPATSYEYQVIGWFNEVQLDLLQSSEFAGLDNDARYNALEQEYRWFVTKDDRNKPFPQRTVCYASLTVTPNNVKPWQAEGAVDLAIGNTGGEALSALLADEVAAPQQPTNKPVIEDQLEAINVAAALQGVDVDYKAHFDQTRHQRGFRGFAGGHRWAVLPKEQRLISAVDPKQDAAPPLPELVAHALDALNGAQEAYDMAQQEIVELRYQTFCDWHKYLAALYSDSQDLQPFQGQSSNLEGFITSQDIKLLDDKVERAGKLVVDKETVKAVGKKSTTSLILAFNALEPKNPANDNLAVQVILRLKMLIDTLNATQITDKFEITNQPAEHFWRPNDPVVLLSGPVAVSTQRHGEGGDLPCAVLSVPDAPGTEAFVNAVESLKPSGPHDPAIQTQTESPWHPIILEWGVTVEPVQIGRKQNPDINNKWDYEPNFITGNFKLSENKPDFNLPDSLSFIDSKSYAGHCLMTPTASTQLDTNLRTYLLKVTLDDCRDRAANTEPDYVNRLIDWYKTKHNVTPPEKDSEKGPWLKQQKPFVADQKDANSNPVLLPVADLFTFYTNKPVAGGTNHTVGNTWNLTRQAQDPIYSAIRALSKLDGKLVLSQALGGFNAALMTRSQVLQIPIEDPMADSDDDFTPSVATAVGPRHPMAPLPHMIFNPIRSGTLSLDSLRLMDTFGQQWNAPLTGAHLVISNSLSRPKEKNQIYLQPRLSTPARLNFRWLAALSSQNGADEVEMNSVPANTPICGWLLPNNFDNSVMVYDNAGRALGSINILAQWTPAPGKRDRIGAGEIPNPHLRRLVRRLIAGLTMTDEEITIRQHFLQSFLSTLDSSIEAIEPASFAQHEALALLMGRPIAVVRARVDLQLMGQTTNPETVDDPTIQGHKATLLKKSRNLQAFADHDWDALAYDWGHYYGCSWADIVKTQSCSFLGKKPDNYARTTHGFEKVVIPLRLGEYQLLNDGMVGFWKETAAGDLDNVFHAPQTLNDVEINGDVIYKPGRTTPCIRPRTADADDLSLTLKDDPLALTILMDPRAVIHATSGILPVYKLEIPSVYYAHALRTMGVTFRVSPILTDAEQLHAAVPKEAGYVWSWITRCDGSTWEETATITDATEHAHFFKPPKIVEGWLKLTPGDKDKT